MWPKNAPNSSPVDDPEAANSDQEGPVTRAEGLELVRIVQGLQQQLVELHESILS